ncbi:hypothetical protein G3T36_05905 [Diaminobutyricibacter tongyongensis]|uniref:DUF7882 domain-containing protein n=1 Tax=Leifsonia tongyongensis TaxID=1268043 RepID=A0A6L9XVD8_9MICO|nr:hypothetical protein [Diaminobutyricibacter tongyongensis]NEN05401.1 hypothetical protein [Diaminobutyricibacter tongyongensis]
MGTLHYGDATSAIEFDDRLLAHLQLAIVTKLRRSESFVFSWDVGRGSGSGYNSVWMSPTVPIRFTYPAGKRGPINRAWVEALLHTANSVAGLRVVDEPAASVESPAQAPE